MHTYICTHTHTHTHTHTYTHTYTHTPTRAHTQESAASAARRGTGVPRQGRDRGAQKHLSAAAHVHEPGTAAQIGPNTYIYI